MNAVNATSDRAIILFNTIPQPPFNVVNPKNRRMIARVQDENVSIIDSRWKESLYTLGINIPPFLRERFKLNRVVYHDDPSFYEAFITAECWNLLRSGYRIEKDGRMIHICLSENGNSILSSRLCTTS